MLKGEEPQEVFISQMTSMRVYIDEDDVGMWQICKIEDGKQVCSIPTILTMGPVTEIICHKLPGLYRFAVAYIKEDGIGYAKYAKYNGDVVWWSEEVMEEGVAIGQWSYMN